MFGQFMYLGHPLVREFLAEGGIFDESRQSVSSARGKGPAGVVKAGPVQANAERSDAEATETESVIRQTAASEFDRLYNILESDGLRSYDVINAEVEELPFGRKEIIEIDADGSAQTALAAADRILVPT